MRSRLYVASAVVCCLVFVLAGSVWATDGSEGRFPGISHPDDSHWWDGFGTIDQRGIFCCPSVLATFRGGLIAAGSFHWAGASGQLIRTDLIARWDGESWHPLGGGVDLFRDCELACGNVDALVEYDGSLVVGGRFPSVDDGLPAPYIALWDGSTWQALGSGMDGDVLVLTVYRGDLIAGGVFETAGGREVHHIARWDGNNWHPLGPGLNSSVLGLAVFEDKLIATGLFTHAGDVEVGYIASWDGSTWSPVGGGFNFLSDRGGVVIYDGDLVVGTVGYAGGVEIFGLARWDGRSWSALGPRFMGTGGVRSMAVYEGDLIGGGAFTGIGNRIVRLNGDAWETLGSGVDGDVESLAVLDGSLYVGGRFLHAGGTPSSFIARWDATVTAVEVSDLQAETTAGGIHLRWRLSHREGLSGVNVQVAPSSQGPYSTRTAAPLVPAHAMQYTDADPFDIGTTLWYRLVLLGRDGSQTLAGPILVALAAGEGLRTALEAPFRPARGMGLQIRYSLARPVSRFELAAYDVRGRRVRVLQRGPRAAGQYSLLWDGTDARGHRLAWGVYLLRLHAAGTTATRRAVLVP